jgi:membrane carboxypeptidase/penicillin-binding protein
VGLDQNEVKLQMRDGFSGASVAAPIVAKFMRATQRVRPELLTGEFERPDNVIELRIDPAANCVRDSGNVKEYFLKGREPLPCSSKR